MTPTVSDNEDNNNGRIELQMKKIDRNLRSAPKKTDELIEINRNRMASKNSEISLEEPDRRPFRKKMSEFLNYVGPGFLITIACLDPGNLSGDIAVGQLTRYRLTWILVLSHIMCYIYQSISLTIGCVTKRDISTLCRYCFSKRIHIILWVMAELALIASDTQEVLGTAIALQILFSVPLIYGVIISIVLAFVSYLFG